MTGKNKPIGWYVVSNDGMTTLCANEQDALDRASYADIAWESDAPHRAMQLCEYTPHQSDHTATERKLRTQINLLTTTNEVLAEKLAAAETAHAAKLAYIRELEDANTPEITALTDRVKALEADAGRYQWLSNYLISDDCQHDDAKRQNDLLHGFAGCAVLSLTGIESSA